MTRRYRVEAMWDSEAKVFYARTDVPGLNVETATMAEYIDVARDLAPELILANEPGPHASAASIRLEATLDLAEA